MGRQKKKRGNGGKVQSQHFTTYAVLDSAHPHHTRTKQEEKEEAVVEDISEGTCGTCVHTSTEPHDRAHAEEQKSAKSKKRKPANKGKKVVVLSDSDEGI